MKSELQYNNTQQNKQFKQFYHNNLKDHLYRQMDNIGTRLIVSSYLVNYLTGRRIGRLRLNHQSKHHDYILA